MFRRLKHLKDLARGEKYSEMGLFFSNDVQFFLVRFINIVRKQLHRAASGVLT